MNHNDIIIMVIGGLNTDIIAAGVDTLLGAGELTRSGNLVIGPGGKSRNMAQMMSQFTGDGRVAMIGKTCRDPYGLWEVPLKALKENGVHTDFITIESFEKTGKFPGIALIPVNKKGENQIYCIPGITDDFSASDLDRAGALFETVAQNNGIMALSLELPLSTAIHGVSKAADLGIRVVLDPGGIDPSIDYTELLRQGLYIIKPNEHEAKMLTGITVYDLESAKKSAAIFFESGIKQVMITHGKHGAYAITRENARHIPIPPVSASGTFDETGCGDQVMAVLCAETAAGADLFTACDRAILAGTLQYQRIGIQPVRRSDLEQYR